MLLGFLNNQYSGVILWLNQMNSVRYNMWI